MKDTRLYCLGCSLLNSFPKNCLKNCPNLTTPKKETPLLINYHLIMSHRNSKNEK